MRFGVIGGAGRLKRGTPLSAPLSWAAKAAAVFAVAVGVFAADAAQAHRIGVPHVHLPAGVGGAKFVRIGSKVVSDRLDRDEVRLPGRERVYQVKLCVRGRAVEFLDLDVRFANGRNQDIPVRRVIRAGQCTRNIDLNRGPRNIRKVVMKYTSLRKKGPQPVVDVYARVAIGDAKRSGPRRNFTQIARKVVADRVDIDTVELPGRERIYQIKLCVRFRAVEFLDLDARFANGRNQDIRVRRVIRPGSCTRNIDLVNAPRNIRRIVMKYTSFNKRGLQPVVEVFAR